MKQIELQRNYAHQLRLQKRSSTELENLARLYEEENISTEGLSPLVDYPLIVHQIKFEIFYRRLFGK